MIQQARGKLTKLFDFNVKAQQFDFGNVMIFGNIMKIDDLFDLEKKLVDNGSLTFVMEVSLNLFI